VSLGGGLRKVRVARDGHGKSGGYRTIHVFADETTPIFLITCFAKNQRTNITQAERKALLALSAQLLAAYRRTS
jgi:hypothetical protein